MRGKRPNGLYLTLAVWLALGLAPVMLDDWGASQLAQYLTYGIFAMSLAFIWGQAGILCFGQAIFFGIGAYIMGLVTLGKLPAVGASQWTGMLLSVLGAGLAGNLIGRALFLGRGLSGPFFAIVTLSAAVILEIVAQHWRFIGGFNGLLGVPALAAPWRSGAEADLTGFETYYFVLAAAALVYLVVQLLARSPFGTVLAAIRQDARRLAYFGYDVARHKIFAFTIASAVAGFAGALFTVQFGFVSPALVGFGLSTEVLIWTAVGGRGILLAALLGAVLVRSVESALSSALGNYWLLALGMLFVATVVLAPSGLFGRLLRLPPPRRLLISREPPDDLSPHLRDL